MRFICQLLCVIMVILYIIPIFVSHTINTGTVVGIIFFIALRYYIKYFQLVNRFLFLKHHKAGIITLVLCAVCFVMCFVSAAHIMDITDTSSDQGTVIVLGCKVGSVMANERIEAAYEYLNDHPSLYCIVSGGRGEDEDMSEAEYMRSQLVDRGINGGRIMMEEAATNTYENLSNSLSIINHKGLSDHIIIISNEFHLYRAGLFAKSLHLSPLYYKAHTAWWLFPTYFTREIIAVIRVWLS